MTFPSDQFVNDYQNSFNFILNGKKCSNVFSEDFSSLSIDILSLTLVPCMLRILDHIARSFTFTTTNSCNQESEKSNEVE